MTPVEKEALLKNLAESRERLLGTVKRLSHTQLTYKPAPDRWSVAENLEHITVVETRVLGFIQKTLEAPSDFSKKSAKEGQEQALVDDIAGRITRFKAPEHIVPTGRWPLDQLTEEFEAARKRSTEFAAGTDADLRHHFFPHPIFGEMDCYQWLLLLGAHCDRHRAQSEEVMVDPGFPKAAAAY